MKEILEFIAKKILPHPDNIQIEETMDEHNNIHLTLITHPDDTGLAIGKEGRTAHALRELLKIKAIQDGVRVFLTIKSTEEAQEEAQKEKTPTQTLPVQEEPAVGDNQPPQSDPTIMPTSTNTGEVEININSSN